MRILGMRDQILVSALALTMTQTIGCALPARTSSDRMSNASLEQSQGASVASVEKRVPVSSANLSLPILSGQPELELLFPPNAAVLRQKELERENGVVVLSWRALADVKGYLVQAARDLEFKELVLEKNVPNNVFASREFADLGGKFFWRVRGEYSSGVGHFSKVRSFSVAEPL